MMSPILSFSNARVLVVGDVMLDRYWHGQASRISPEAPVPVVHVEDVTDERPGGAANVSVTVAALGAQTALLGVTGDDEAGKSLERRLQKIGVEYRFTRLSGPATVTKIRVLSRHQQLIRLDLENSFEGKGHRELLTDYESMLSRVDSVALSDYGKGTLANAQEFIVRARAAGKPVLVDPKGSDFSRYSGATVITPNLTEFESVVGSCRDLDELVARGEALLRELDIHAIVITRSDQGMTLLRGEHKPVHVSAQAREVYDVTGAGDTVVGVLAAAVAAGRSLPEAMMLSNVAAGIVVGKLGTASVSTAELMRVLDEQTYDPSCLLTRAELLSAVAGARERGETIVMTNGCFDILHAGHVSYLERARALGDRLVVAVNDDGSVQRLKGEGRPINTLSHRTAVLAALKSVDWLVAFSEDTPEELIGMVLPDVLVKGGDYRADEIAGANRVQAQGGRVDILDFEHGCSTTKLIDAINQAAMLRKVDRKER